MSHQPPHGPPPPYGYPPGVAYVPAPVMMPMYPHPTPQPMPQPVPAPAPSQPTYVTNYYYPPEHAQPQPPPQPILVQGPQPPPTHGEQVVDLGIKVLYALFKPKNTSTRYNDVDWVSVTAATAAQYSHRAFVAGKEGWDGSPLWVIRAHHSGEFIPGKLAIKHAAAYVPHQGKEVPVHQFDVLLAKPHAVRWIPSSNGHVPPGAIAAGNTHAGEPLYIARVHIQNSITPGKVHPSHQCAYISFSGNEMSFKQYEVLCRVQNDMSALAR